MDIVEQISEILANKVSEAKDEGNTEEITKYAPLATKSLNMLERLDEILYYLKNYKEAASKEDVVVWVERDENGLGSVNVKPVYVGEHLYNNFFRRQDLSCVLASATLSVGESFDYIKHELGLNLCSQEVPVPEPSESEEDVSFDTPIQVFDPKTVFEFIGESPFNLTKQQLWYLPEDAVDADNSNRVEFESKLPRQIELLVKACGGGALCLFTSNKSLNSAYKELQWELKDYTLLKQGDKPKTQLIEDFKKDKDSVLFATRSFFTGIDVPGDALRCLIVDKLPFPSPTEPVMQKKNMIDPKGAFNKYFIPEMIITLKQAIGRGVRSIDDKCVICVLDNRMATARYKTKIAYSFNYPKTLTRKIDDVCLFIEGRL